MKIRPTPIEIRMMELVCHFFDIKPRQADICKISGDKNGYFYTAKTKLFNDYGKSRQDMADYDTS